eukprot:scaffold110467_cov63-Phaeocystis_antarctica.AAC.5
MCSVNGKVISLLGHLLRERLLRLLGGRLRLDTHDASAPRALDRLGVLVVLLADSGHQLAELMTVLESRGWRGVSGLGNGQRRWLCGEEAPTEVRKRDDCSRLELAPQGVRATGRWRRGGGAHLAADRGQGKRGRGLLVHEGSQARLALDDAIGDVHLAAHRRQPHDELPG